MLLLLLLLLLLLPSILLLLLPLLPLLLLPHKPASAAAFAQPSGVDGSMPLWMYRICSSSGLSRYR